MHSRARQRRPLGRSASIPLPSASAAPGRIAITALAVGLALLGYTSSHAQTQQVPAAAPQLAAVSLEDALSAYAQRAGVTLSYDPALMTGLRASPASGQGTPAQVLEQLLAGSGLRLIALDASSFSIVRSDVPDQGAAPSVTTADDAVLPVVTVVASRAPRSIEETPNTIWVIEHGDIEQQARAGLSLKEMLGQLIPGLDLGGQMRTNFGQNLRGRAAQVMIDGIGLNGSRTLSRQFDSIDPFNIERIEVLSGATAVYGGNALGGIINIVTKRASAGAARFTSQVGLVTGAQGSDDLSWQVAQSVQGGNETVQGRLAIAYNRAGGAYDGDGRRVLPDITQTDLQWNRSLDVLANGDAFLSNGATVKGLAQFYDSGYQPGKALWMQPGAGNSILQPSALDIRSGFSSDVKPRTRRHLLALDYHQPNVLGKQDFYFKAHHRSESLQFYPFPGNDANPLGGNRVPYWSTSTQETTTYGAKLMLLKNWDRLQLTYGADYDHERFNADQTMFDIDRAIDSGGLEFRRTAVLGRYPSFETDIYGLYVQADWKPTDRLTASAGLRRQQVNIEVDDFVQVAQQRLMASGIGRSAEAIPGGKNDYAATLANVGVLYHLTPGQQVWANYSEGFELADPAKYYGTAAAYTLEGGADGVWRLGRHISVNDTSMAAIKTRSAELGWRIGNGPLSVQAALFHSESDKAIAIDRSTLNISLNDSEVRNRGLEAQIDYRFGNGWYAGSNMLLMRTEERTDAGWKKRGIYYASPSKVTAYVGRETGTWAARLQAVHSLALSSETPSFGGDAGNEHLPSLTLFDVMGSYHMRHAGMVRATLSVGVQNLLDKTYTTRWSEQARLAYASSIAPQVLDFRGRGRTFAVTYTLEY